jgi:hypothetical protein
LTWHYENIATRHISLESSGALNVLNPGEAGGAVFQVGGNTVWHAGNDGSGSGLDADLLDGEQGSNYLRSNVDDTFDAGYLAWPTLHLSIANNNSTNGYNTYFRGSSSHFVLGLANGNTLYLNYGNTSGSFRAYGGNFMWNDASIGSPWGSTNDGSGSGLDADTVDGVHASSFMRNDTTNHEIRFDNEEYDFSWTAHSQINPLSLKVWNNYQQSGAPSTYGTLLDIYGMSGHAHSQIHFDANSYTMRLRYAWYGSTAWSSWAILWNSLNDGSGSGLDADLLDGAHASSFARVDSASDQNFTGSIKVSSNNVTGGGIILADDGDFVDLNDGYASMRFSYGVRVFSANRGGSAVHTLHSNGTFTASGNVTAYSDIRLKEGIEVIPDAVNKVRQLRGVTFTRNDQEDKEKRHAGVIAQEVEEVLPEVVATDDKGIKHVAYGNMVGLLIEAIKELKAEVDDLKAQLKEK